ncbi:MAG: hypothetical protein JEY79_00810 [Pseudodesulfovibrio sp.]|nr:hypothetical protein [Pseudodesulfovibrio sp.]
MTTIMPQSELTRKAIFWICEMQEGDTDKSLDALIEDAAIRFNMGPRDVEFLQRFYRDKKD